jgi:hypothetical protein
MNGRILVEKINPELLREKDREIASLPENRKCQVVSGKEYKDSVKVFQLNGIAFFELLSPVYFLFHILCLFFYFSGSVVMRYTPQPG